MITKIIRFFLKIREGDDFVVVMKGYGLIMLLSLTASLGASFLGNTETSNKAILIFVYLFGIVLANAFMLAVIKTVFGKNKENS